MNVTVQRVSTHNLYRRLSRFHDLWIILAWGGVLAAIFLNTFYNRGCYNFVTEGFSTATCQTPLDWGFIFLAAFGAGLSIWEERIAVLGFIFAHLIATVLFVFAVVAPPLIGATDPVFLDSFVTQAIVLALLSSFPVALFLSLIGSMLGLFIGGKLPMTRSVDGQP